MALPWRIEGKRERWKHWVTYLLEDGWPNGLRRTVVGQTSVRDSKDRKL